MSELLEALSESNDYYDNWPRWLRQAVGILDKEDDLLESDFWSWLRDELTTTVANLHLQRIESGSTAAGIPDVNLCWQGVEAWVELKVATLTKREPVRAKIRLANDQAQWMSRRCRAGGRAWLCVAVPAYEQSEGRWGEILLFEGAFAPKLIKLLQDVTLADLKDYATLVLPKQRGPRLRALIETITGKEAK